ncbi:gamma-glutamyl kinase [Neokomagataea thailandica NBRC 106555]|uniref:Glutamate 5-kinase n=2 Tax=Neokomagataea TaxID=1223423 RepID=A0A4Y6V9V6_9PROT|nr:MULTISPECIES: glutamate 5-kinase [Neokomagataea]QDH25266.1 glutamate 5-kinase [Neokomagataea tanensis]GBR54264.1 gamma-glutamyl kinase [Neokomagataea thailandica NBRC 106555]
MTLVHGEGGTAPSLSDARRIVIKIGSALLVDPERATLRTEWLAGLCADIAQLKKAGRDVIVVSSGAIALARHQLGKTNAKLRLEEKQALASIGQIGLAQGWQNALSLYGLTAGQLLLTQDDTEDRERHLNARATLETLLQLGCVPIINENDAVATSEIRFGDNDRLAARVAQMTASDTLILLSDIDGLYTADPRKEPEARFLPVIEHVTDDVMALGGEPPPGYSSGGMRTKLLAARIANRAGTNMIIASGYHPSPIKRLIEGGLCTWFCAEIDTGSARKRWIGSGLSAKGSLTVDAGAEQALSKGASLLSAGISRVSGKFKRGDLIAVCNQDDEHIAIGLANYNSDEVQRLVGQRTCFMPDILGYCGPDELIHRDNLSLLKAW